MANLHHPPPQVIIRVDIDRIPAGHKTGPDSPRHLPSPPPSRPGDEGRGDIKIHRWAENTSLSCPPRNRGEGRRPTSSRSVGGLDSRPRSSRGGGRVDRRPASSRTDSRPDSRALSPSRHGGRPDNLPQDSQASGRLESRPPSSGTRGRSKRRPLSSRSRGSRSPTSRTRCGVNNRISANCNGLIPSRYPPSRPQSSGQIRSPSSTHSSGYSKQLSRRPPSSSRPGSRSGDSSHPSRPRKEPDERHLSPRSLSPEGRGSVSPAPERAAEGRRRRLGSPGKRSERRPRSSQVSGGRVGSASGTSRGAGGSRSGKKNRPWTAPVSGRGRVPENLHEDYYGRTGGGSSWMSPGECSDETKHKQEEIIRRILEEFDLEETMDKYRNSNAVVIRRDGKSLADFRFRSEMIRMMGSEEIRLNDQDWSKRFQRRLVEDYERLLDEKENNLAKAEKQRIHRLRVEGILHDPQDSFHSIGADPWFNRTPHAHSKKKSRNSPRWRRAQSDSSDSFLQETKPVFVDDKSDNRERGLLAHRQEKIYSPPDDVQTQMDRMYREGETGDEEETGDRDEQGTEKDRGEEREKDGRSERRSLIEGEDPEEKTARLRRKRYKHLPPRVARLYEEETVSGLYKIASDLLDSENEESKKGVKIIA